MLILLIPTPFSAADTASNPLPFYSPPPSAGSISSAVSGTHLVNSFIMLGLNEPFFPRELMGAPRLPLWGMAMHCTLVSVAQL